MRKPRALPDPAAVVLARHGARGHGAGRAHGDGAAAALSVAAHVPATLPRMSQLEAVAALLGVLCVALTIARSIWCWPVGLAMVACYTIVFWHARLYSDALLQLVYVVLQVYGWWFWLGGGASSADARVPVRRLGARGMVACLVVAAVGTAGLGTTMHRFTDADLPYWDASTTVLSLIAQWLLGRKLLEAWPFWVVVDVLSIGIYAYKELHVTAALYAIFLGMAVTGWWAWRRAAVPRGARVAAPTLEAAP